MKELVMGTKRILKPELQRQRKFPSKCGLLERRCKGGIYCLEARRSEERGRGGKQETISLIKIPVLQS